MQTVTVHFPLLEYFAKFWGPFEHIFATLDDLGVSISNAMNITSQVCMYMYKAASYLYVGPGFHLHQPSQYEAGLVQMEAWTRGWVGADGSLDTRLGWCRWKPGHKARLVQMEAWALG